MRVERTVSFAIVIILLGIVLWRGASTGFVTAQAFQPVPDNGCVDGDLGFTPTIASLASVGSVELRDICAENGGLFEAMCKDGKAVYEFVNCGHDVSVGSVCVREGLGSRCS